MDRSAWNGTFELKETKNVKEFMEKLGANPEQIKAVEDMKVINELSSSGDDYCMKQKAGGKENVISLTLGTEAEITTIDGLTLKGTVTIDKNNEVCGKYVGGIEERMTITSDGTITDTVSLGGVSMVRTYKRK